MKHDSKASSAESNLGNGNGRGCFRPGFATRRSAGDVTGSGASSPLRGVLVLLLFSCLALGVAAAPASAAPPTTTMGSVSAPSYASAHVTGEVNAGGFAQYSFQYSTDQVNWTDGGGAFLTGSTFEPVSADLSGLKGGTTYFVRLVATNFSDPLAVSPGPNPQFTTLPVDPPIVISTDDAAEVGYVTAKASGEVERPANADPAFDTECRFEYIPAAKFGDRDEVQQVTIKASGGTFNLLTPKGSTPALPFDVSAAAMQTALEALVGAGTVTVTGGPGDSGGTSPYAITFGGSLANKDIEQLFIESSSLTPMGSASGEITTTTEGHAEGFEGGGQAPCEPESSITTPGAAAVTANLTGLTPGTTYRLRLRVSNGGGSDAKESANPFTTLPVSPPVVTIDPIDVFTDTTAHFSGEITPGGTDPAFETSWHVECTPACPGPNGTLAPSTSPQPVDAVVSGLEPNTFYEVKLVATNAGGTESATTTFQTEAVGPSVETFPAFALGSGTEALVGGKVNPKNSATTYWIEYGPGPGGPGATYSAALPVAKDGSVGAGGQPLFVTEKITGLTPGSLYHYRLVAENASGETEGLDVGFESVPTPAAPGDCPNVKLRTETGSAALPDCRAYEQASDVNKNGGDANGVDTSSADGGRVSYYSPTGIGTPIANNLVNTYMAQRGPSGWATRSMVPPVESSGLGVNGGYYGGDFSEDLSKSVQAYYRDSAEQPNVYNLILKDADGSEQWVTAPTVTGTTPQPKIYEGRSADASHIVFSSTEEFIPGVTGNQIWEWANGQIRLVSRAPETDLPIGSINLALGSGTNGGIGTTYSGSLPEPTVVSADGSRIFFGGNGYPLFVRENGAVTKVVSVSHRTGSVGEWDTSGKFLGAAADGSIVYFKSAAQLTDDAPPTGTEGEVLIYSHNLETDALHYLAKGSIRFISADGRRAYFASPEQLIADQGETGSMNLYTIDDEGNHLAFVGDIGGGEVRFAQATSDGGRFVFESPARLTAFDNAGHREVYLYDADADALRCVSCKPDGVAATGDSAIRTTPEGTASFGTPRVITSDGSRVFFQTQDSLVPQDVNGVNDVYEYDEGRISLISAGTSGYPSEVGDNSADGQDVFFITRDSLVGQDIDGGATDVYDARVNGGFPAPVLPEPCEGEAACQGAPSTPPSFRSPGTASLNGRGNIKPKKQHKSCKKRSKKHCGKKHNKRKHKSKKHDGKNASKSGRGK